MLQSSWLFYHKYILRYDYLIKKSKQINKPKIDKEHTEILNFFCFQSKIKKKLNLFKQKNKELILFMMKNVNSIYNF